MTVTSRVVNTSGVEHVYKALNSFVQKYVSETWSDIVIIVVWSGLQLLGNKFNEGNLL